MTDGETLPQSAIVPVSNYVIIGGTGDLSLRKIFPALFLRYAAGQVTNDFRLFVVGRQEINVDEFREKLTASLHLGNLWSRRRRGAHEPFYKPDKNCLH